MSTFHLTDVRVPGSIPLCCGMCFVDPDPDDSETFAYTLRVACERHRGVLILMWAGCGPSKDQRQRLTDDVVRALQEATWRISITPSLSLRLKDYA